MVTELIVIQVTEGQNDVTAIHRRSLESTPYQCQTQGLLLVFTLYRDLLLQRSRQVV